LTLAMLLSMLSGFGIVAQADVSTDGIGFDFAEEFYPSIKSGNDLYHLSRPFDKYPHTFEAWIAFPNTPTEASVLMGNSADDAGNFANIEVNTSGNPVFRYRDTVANAYVVTFSNVNLYTGAWIHLAITLDPASHTLNCYVDGKLAQSEYFYPDFSRHTFNNEFVIGGDHDYQNNPHFKGRVKQVAFFADARTEAEIKADMTNLATTDADYIAGFDMTADKAKKDIADKSGNGWYLNYSDLWLTEAEVEAWRQSTGMDRAYSIAVIGDIQYSTEFFPETLAPMYQWIVDNKDAKNTVYSIGLGDITNRDTIYEWENAKNAMSVMDGKIPYSVVRGNHDLKAYSASANNNYHTGSSNYVNNSGNIGASSKGAAIDQYFATNTYYTDQFFNNGTNGGVYEEGSVMNTWRILEVAKSKWLLLNLDYAPSDSVRDWSAGVVDAHPDCKVIVSTHSYLSRNGEHNREGAYVGEKGESGVTVPGGYTDANLGVDIWEDFVSRHENIEMVLSGHIASTVNPVVQRKGVHGNTVTEILIDGQQIDDRYNGMGFVAMFFFNEDGTKLEIEYYSNVVGKYYRGANLREIDLTAEGLPYNANEWEGLSIAPEGKGTYEE
ncbi:MAG: metallophosphoesterase, partial [Clostridia bacterium]|nr:metallophosphoesterase [Clostridia bacterium]